MLYARGLMVIGHLKESYIIIKNPVHYALCAWRKGRKRLMELSTIHEEMQKIKNAAQKTQVPVSLQLESDDDVSDKISDESIIQLKSEVILLSKQMTSNIIEIGKRLEVIKEMVGHGEWGKWVEQNLPFSWQWACKYIKAYQEFGNLNSSINLPQKKLFMLLDVPSDERVDFISKPHELDSGEVKTVDKMTTREFQEAIKARKEAEIKNTELKNKNLELEGKVRELESKPEKVIPVEKVIERIPDDYETIKSENNRLVGQNKTLFEQKKEIAKQLQESKSLHTDIISYQEFQDSIGYFLGKMAKYTYYSEAFNLLERREQTEFLKLIEKLETWCIEAKQAVKGEKSEKTIIFEGGFISE